MNIWDNLTKWYCITVIFVSKGSYTEYSVYVEMQSGSKLLSDGKEIKKKKEDP